MTMLTANIVLETFHKGGWVMWPVLGTFFLAFCVLIERVIWWLGLAKSIESAKQDKARDALGFGDFETAWALGQKTSDPFLLNLREGISHAHTSMLAAMQLHAADLIEKSEARQWVLSTVITLAPLLGLMGTVVGLMGSFGSLGDETLGVTKVTGGISEALIATACGLGIAIACLLPYNYFRKRVSSLRNALERWINHAELLVHSAKSHGHDLEAFAASKNLPR
jgi:biopolymer transport protein ExbB